MNYGITLNEPDLSRFSAVEVDCVVEFPWGCERTDESEVPRIREQFPHALTMWSVYLRYDPEHPLNEDFGGAECVGDFPTKEAALAFGSGLEVALEAVREVSHA